LPNLHKDWSLIPNTEEEEGEEENKNRRLTYESKEL
jgi:hypothetical protein